MLLQRVENVVGLIGTESSPFGAIFSEMLEHDRGTIPFNYLTVRTWRDIARYAAPEAGPGGRLAAALADGGRPRGLGAPQAPAAVSRREYLVHFGGARRSSRRRRRPPPSGWA